ncbi:MAG: endonuclease MutS2 [bacterium]
MTNLAELYTLLEFDKILSYLVQFAISSMGKEKIEQIVFMTNKDEIEIALKEVSELKAILDYDDTFPLDPIWDLRKALEIAGIEGNYLDAETLVRISQTLTTSWRVHSYLQKRSEKYPHLWAHTKKIKNFKNIEKEIRAALDFQTFEVKDSASPELNRIRKEISRAEQNARKVVESLFKTYSKKGYLQEELITIREGRLVLPVKSEHKDKVKGLVHDHSSSGATFFIEPFQSVELNNQIRGLRGEEAQEVVRILRNLTGFIRDELENISQNLGVLAHLDFIQAKARFSQILECHSPALNENNIIEIFKAKHPLLMLRKDVQEKVVPLDLKMGEDYHTLVITGPNAGGKTVALKTVGLFALMVQTGLPIPADPDSKIPIFENIFADIGDLQSIEQNLSTFTSHMKRIQNILENAHSKSLVLVDEIGVGTDPEEGAALAMAFLENLTQRGSITIVTTHQSTLKAFAYERSGVENGSMEFDVETLRPTYKFQLGIPGSSYAIEIAKRLGISDGILSRSRELVGIEKGNFERLLLDLEKKIQENEKLIKEVKIEKTRLEGLTKLYRERYEAIKKKENVLKEKALEDSQEILNRANAAVEQAIKEIKEKQAAQEAIKRAKNLIEQEKAQIAKTLNKIERKEKDQEIYSPAQLQIGEEVYWEKQNTYGKIVSFADHSDKALIEVGNLKFWVPISELSLRKKKMQDSIRPSQVKIQTSTKSNVLPEIDLRGQRLDEAIKEVDKFLDDALLAGWHQVRIIHGKGTGALRKGISEFLETHPNVKNKRPGAWNEGDIGVTVVELE